MTNKRNISGKGQQLSLINTFLTKMGKCSTSYLGLLPFILIQIVHIPNLSIKNLRTLKLVHI